MPLTVLTYATSFSLLTHPYSHVTATTTDHSTYPIYSTVGPSSSQPSSSLPSLCLSPPPSVQSSEPPQPLPSPAPSSSTTALSFPFPFSLEAPSSCSPDQPTPMETPGTPAPTTDKTTMFVRPMVQTILRSTSRCTSASSFTCSHTATS